MIQRSNDLFLEIKINYILENDWKEGPEEEKCGGIIIVILPSSVLCHQTL
jgi:metal-responsive CopG/Arc/MetJ family transcriptional regulator